MKTEDKKNPMEEEDEFEQLLNEFIDCNWASDEVNEEESTEEEESSEKEETDEEETDASVQITGIRIAFSPDEEFGGCFTDRTQFRLSPDMDFLHTEIEIHNPYYQQFRWSRKLKIILSCDDYELDETVRTFQMNSQDTQGRLYVTFRLPDVIRDEYATLSRLHVTVYHDYEAMYTKHVEVVTLPEHYTTCFRHDSFALYRVNEGEEVDYGQLGNSHGRFNARRLGSILMVETLTNLLGQFNKKLLLEYTPQFELRLYDETGRIKATEIQEAESHNIGEKKCLSLCWEMGRGKRNFWPKGTYLVEVLFMDETILSVPFEVGNKDMESIYSKDSIQPKRNIAGKKIVRSDKVEEPLQVLNSLIGLAGVKQKINDYRDLMFLEQKRAALGLPVQAHSIHAAFIGNPGTGKTTVAGLLGKILKEMGILSKGHVVYEERGTLLGQFYSSEGEKTLAALERAKGGILFIDEAYTLYKPEDPKDPGMNVLETLLTALSDESNRDWMLLLAGYPAPMKAMLTGNPGLESRIPESNRYYFDDYDVEELMQIADLYCQQKCYRLTKEARNALMATVKRAYGLRDETFGNGRYIQTLLNEEVLLRMAKRVNAIPVPTQEQLVTIEREDIPHIELKDYRKSWAGLQQMVGLKQLKKSIGEHLNFIHLVRLRSEQGIHTTLPPMHMVFTGNPGTGKTTVADFMGEIYASLGLLSKGNVVRVERSDFIDTRVGGTELKTKAILKSAQGNVLFIDEAYTLLDAGTNSDDSGKRVLETLLTALSREETDMLVIMAGYPEEMKRLLASNPGLKSRFPYIFHFEDYTADELMEIADGVAAKEGYRFSAAATKALRALISKEVRRKDRHFGNGRYVTRLIATRIIPAMSSRIAALPEKKQRSRRVLQTIQVQDIPVTADELQSYADNGFDEKCIAGALRRLDAMIGLRQVKKAIHDFVDVSRYLHGQGRTYAGNGGPLKWSFTGNTGTGKSTVAGIMAELLRAMNLLGKGQLIELKAEEIYNVQDYKVDEILKNAMKRSQHGVLFVDGDARYSRIRIRILIASGYVFSLRH